MLLVRFLLVLLVDLNVLAHRLVGYAMQVGNKTWLGYPPPLNDVMVSCMLLLSNEVVWL